MITIQLPNISIQKVTNGYVVQWHVKNKENKIETKTAVCADSQALLTCIDCAAKDIHE